MSLVEKISELAKPFGVATAYGDPVSIEGRTMVPVALVGYGFGGGSGEGDSEGAYEPSDHAGHLTGHGRGEGAGGGGCAIPIGAYVNTDGGLRFQPNLIAALSVGIPFVLVTGRVIARIVRAAKR
jgi:uncharacterized spore protein YtfJ